MKQTSIIMGMPITVEVVGNVRPADIAKVFDFFKVIDKRFSPFKPTSELSKINAGLPSDAWSREMKQLLALCQDTKFQTNGYFDITTQNGQLDPSGLVKGWAVNQAAMLLAEQGYLNYYIEAGGDIQTSGQSPEQQPWKVGIRNPFDLKTIVKTIQVSGEGVATSGNYIRGEHIYNPHNRDVPPKQFSSVTVIAPNVYEADRFATATFAMGQDGPAFIENIAGFEAYLIDANQIATYTTGFSNYVI